MNLDSIDQLNVVVRLDGVLGIKTTESDYSKLYTLNGMLDYLESRVDGAGAPGPPTGS